MKAKYSESTEILWASNIYTASAEGDIKGAIVYLVIFLYISLISVSILSQCRVENRKEDIVSKEGNKERIQFYFCLQFFKQHFHGKE